jgi:hypothetical protein
MYHCTKEAEGNLIIYREDTGKMEQREFKDTSLED